MKWKDLKLFNFSDKQQEAYDRCLENIKPDTILKVKFGATKTAILHSKIYICKVVPVEYDYFYSKYFLGSYDLVFGYNFYNYHSASKDAILINCKNPETFNWCPLDNRIKVEAILNGQPAINTWKLELDKWKI